MHQVGSEVFSEEAWRVLKPWEMRFDDQLARLQQMQIDIRRHLHAHPEPSGGEVETSKFVAQRLEKAGLHPWFCRSDAGNQVGVIADLEIGRPSPESPLIALRCDLDALRMPDEKTVEYASRNPGLAHACGHDAHTAILLGVALAGAAVNAEFDETAADFGGRLRFLFQPAEETSQGAQWLVDQGAMEGVQAVLGLHVDPERPAGQVGIRYGALTANCDEIEIVVEGHGGHAARPHQSTDPVAAAAHLVSTIYEFLPRAIDSRSPSVITIGKIQGGHAPNVIPERVELHGTLRTIDPASQQILKVRLQKICAGAEQSSGTKITLRFSAPLKSVENHPRMAAALEQASRRVVGPENTGMIDRPSLGGEDFSVYLDFAPGALLRLGCADQNGNPPFLHSPKFDIDERTLAIGSQIMMRAALLLAVQTPTRTGEG